MDPARRVRCFVLNVWMLYCCGCVDAAAILAQPQSNTDSSLSEQNAINVALETDLQVLRDNFSRETRCYCNLPVCVTTGYMCKSALATCFSEVVNPQDLSQTRHGCLELLNNRKEKMLGVIESIMMVGLLFSLALS